MFAFMRSHHLLKQLSNPFQKQDICVSRLKWMTNFQTAMETDVQRLNQILKNLLSNSFKFTEKGEVNSKFMKHNKLETKSIQILIMQKVL